MNPGGEPAGFVLELENGFKLSPMGDTGLFGDMRLIAEYSKPDLVMIPIGGHVVMDPRDGGGSGRPRLLNTRAGARSAGARAWSAARRRAAGAEAGPRGRPGAAEA